MRIVSWLAAAAAAMSLTAAASPRPLADLTVTDRVTGETLPVYWHRGERWVAGAPGHRYSITIRNRHGGRLLTVLSVDGINAVTGETAAWDQSGYVFGPRERGEIRGWRKSQERIAAFEFTALPNSYAARTGRPDHVGAIGVAVFREAVPVAPPYAPAPSALGKSQRGAGEADTEARDQAGSAAPAASAAERADGDSRARESSRLGTGHGRSESSYVGLTKFERAQPNPDEIITIRYDSRQNLIAMGIIAQPQPQPNPFPGSLGFVPDPPRP